MATLAGCGNAGTGRDVADQADHPRGTAAAPEPGLLGLWDLRGAGEAVGTALELSGGHFLLMRRCGEVTGTWGARGGLFIGQSDYGTGEDLFPGSPQAVCPQAERAAPAWLDDVTGYRSDGTGWDLVDAAGSVVVELFSGADWPAGHAQERGYAEVTMGDGREDPYPSWATRAELNAKPAAPLPLQIRPATEADLIGRWSPGVPGCEDSFIEFQPNGSWIGGDSGLEKRGGWRLGSEGLALGSAANVRGEGCAAGQPSSAFDGRTSFVDAWMMRLARLGVDGSELVFFDADGLELARVRRAAPPTPEPTPEPQEPQDPRYAGVKVPGGVKYLVPYAEHQMYFGPRFYFPEYERDWPNDALLGVDHSGKGGILLTGCWGGDMWITVRSRTTAPPALARSMNGWEVGEEQTMMITKALFGTDYDGTWHEKVFSPTVPGLHRVRVLAKGRAIAYDDVCERPVEEYEITIWPVLTQEPRERRGDDGV